MAVQILQNPEMIMNIIIAAATILFVAWTYSDIKKENVNQNHKYK